MTRRESSFAGASADERLQRIYATVDSIPSGCVATYGQVAELAGLPGRARLVGTALRRLPQESQLPWHRVLGASGAISERPGPGPREQRRRLRNEGVEFKASGRIDLKRFRWDEQNRS